MGGVFVFKQPPPGFIAEYFGGGGKGGSSTSTVSIPPEVLARYNAVNARAETVAQQPFQQYGGEFVAPVNNQQQAGMQATNAAAGQAQPYYGAATNVLQQAQQAGTGYLGAATGQLGQAQQTGENYAQGALQAFGQGADASAPYYQMATQGLGAGLGYAAPLNYAAAGSALGASGASSPYYQAATQGTQAALRGAQPYQRAGTQAIAGAAGAAQPYFGGATEAYGQAINQANPLQAGAEQAFYGAGQAAQPYYGAATQGTQAALAGAQPYQQMATQAALAGGQAVNPNQLQTDQYMNPYVQNVVGATQAALGQQFGQQRAQQQAEAIKAGAFGGGNDRRQRSILQGQQALAESQAISPLYSQGYNQALQTAQQQQGVGLGAAQANRAATQQTGQQLAALGQQGFGQQLGAANQMAGLGAALYGQGMQGGQALQGLAQQKYGQQTGLAQGLAGLGQNMYQQGIGTGQALLGAGQQGYQQQTGTAQQLAGLGQSLYGQGIQGAQTLSQLGQTGFGQGVSASQQAQALGQGLFGQGMQSGQALAGLGQQQYGQGSQTAQQLAALGQQGYGMGSQTSQQLAGLGTGAQSAALQGAQAQMAAGQVAQQTQQAADTAQYQQFLQERGYPYQQAQFLANIAMGTGALSGSTTTTNQSGGFFSDKRLKDDVKEIGKTNDGQPIYSYKYKGDDRTQIGLMAQDVEKKHPEAVGLMGGYKTVDYKKATEDAERPHKDIGGGLMPDSFDANSMGGAVTAGMAGEGFERGGYVGGGLVGNDDWSQIVAANKAALGVYGGAQPMGSGAIGAGGIVPAASIPTPKLVTASAPSSQRPGGLSSAMQTGKDIAGAYKMGKEGLIGSAPTKDDPTGSAGLWGGQGKMDGQNIFSKGKDFLKETFAANGGLIVPRHAYALGGGDDSQADEAIPYDPSDVIGGKDPMEGVLKAGSQKHELQTAKTGGGGGGGGSGLGNIASALGAAKTIGQAGAWLGDTALPFLMALKDGGRIEHAYASGGLVPRQGYDDGGPVDTGSLFSSLEQKYDLPAGYLNRTWQIESGGGKTLYNEGSGAAGHFQFIPGTQKMMGLQNPYDLAESADATARLAAQNREYLRKGGIDEPTGAHLYLAHQQGPLGATRLLNAADRPAGLVVGEKAVTGNRGDPNARGLDFANQIMSKYEGTQGPESGPIPATIPRPPGLVGAGLQPAAGGEGKKSLGDTLTSEGFLVPALGFVGSMLASNRPNLGQALGEGIMGGVGAYQSQQKQLADIAKTKAETGQMLPVATARNIEAANKLATGLMQYNASLPPGSPKLTLQQYAKIVGYEGPLPSGTDQAAQKTVSSPSAVAPAAAGETPAASNVNPKNWSLSPDEKDSLIIKYPDGTSIPAGNDPAYLRKYAQRYTTMGEGWAKEQAEAAQKSAEDIVRQGKTIDANGQIVPIQGAIESGQKQEIGAGLAKEALEFNQASQKYLQESKNIVSVLDDLGKNYSVYRAGSDAPARANFDRLMNIIDPNNKYPNLHPDESWKAKNYDKAVKDAFQLSVAQLTALSPRAPKAELDTLARTIPLPNLDPGAIQELIGDAKARVLWNQALHEKFDVNKNIDVNKFQKEFERQNPFSEFKKSVKETIPAAAGTQQQRDQAAVPQSSEALQWAKANPSDPRSAEILKRLGVQ